MAAEPASTGDGPPGQAEDAARAYLEVMAGFGFAAAPAARDPAAEAAEAVAFLEALWAADEDGDDASAEARGAVSGTQAADGNIPGAGGPGEYERLARAAADSVFVPSQALDANAGRVACVQQERLAREAVEDVRRCRAAHEEASARAHACSEIVNHMKAEVAELNELVAAAGNGTPGGRNGVPELSQLLTWQADRQRALDAETAIAAMATGEVWKRNAELDAAERHAQKLTALRDDVAAQRAADLQTQRALAERLVAKQEQDAARRAKRIDAEQERGERAASDARAQERRALAAAKEGHMQAVRRLREARAAVQATERAVDARSADAVAKRERAAAELQASVRAVHDDMRQRADLYRAKLASAKAQHEAEFARLLDAGQNPYAVARQRAVQASVRRQQAAIVKALRDGKERITQRLLAEEGTWRRELAAAKKEAAYARKFEKEMGREALEGRVDEYMLSHTREHVAVLDPTSRLPVVPEQDTVTKTWAFGRGGARADVVEKVASQHTPEEAGLIPALLPRKLARAVDKSKGVEWSAQGDEGESRPPGPQRCAPVPLRKPSVMEQRMIEKAAATLRQGVTKPQMWRGRPFDRPLFLATPPTCAFTDCVPGVPQRVRVTLTNVSYGKCTFKLLPLADDAAGLFVIKHEPPGQISPGMASKVDVTYTARAECDVDSELALLTSSGPLSVPIRCRRRIASVSVCPDQVDLGDVLVGASVTRAAITIKNSGALPVTFSIAMGEETPPGEQADADADDKRSVAEDVEPRDEQQPATPFSVAPSSDTCGGHASGTVGVAFSPQRVGARACVLTIRIRVREASDLGALVTADAIAVRVMARGVALPLRVENPNVDFACCFVDTLYRCSLRLRNRQKGSAVKAAICVPEVARHLLEASPKVGFVQAEQTFSFALTLKVPAGALADGACRYVTSRDSDAVLEVPIAVKVGDRSEPREVQLLHARVRASVTPNRILVQPASLDFATCALAEETRLPLTLTNTAKLAQDYGFIDLPRGVRILDGDEVGTLPPGDTKCAIVGYTPDVAGPQRFNLACQTLALQTYNILCTAQAVKRSLAFQHNRIKVAATATGSSTTVSTIFRNVGKAEMAFALAIPNAAAACLTVVPDRGCLRPGAQERVQITFAPRPGARVAGSSGDAAFEAAAEAKEGAGQVNAATILEPYERQTSTTAADEVQQPRVWHIQCQAWQARRSADADAPSGDVSGPTLTVETCEVAARVALAGVPFDAERCRYALRAPPTALGQRTLLRLDISNLTDADWRLAIERPDPLGPFQLAHAPRAALVPHGMVCQRLSFAPRTAKVHWELLRLGVPGHVLEVDLEGEGVQPRLVVEADAGGTLDLGDLSAGMSSRRDVRVSNPCPFPVTFRCALRGKSQANVGALAPLTVGINGATLAPGESASVPVTARPDWQAPYFEDTLAFEIAGDECAAEVCVRARAWQEGLFLAGEGVRYSVPPGLDPPLTGVPDVRDADAAREVVATIAEPIRAGESGYVTLRVCSLRSAAGAAPVELVLEPLPQRSTDAGWSADKLKVAAGAGDAGTLTITHAPPATPGPCSRAAHGDVEVATVVVTAHGTGGAPALPPSPGRLFRIVVRARVVPSSAAAATRPPGAA